MILNRFLAGASLTAMVAMLSAGPAQAQMGLFIPAGGAAATIQSGAGQSGAGQPMQSQSATPSKAESKKRKKRQADARANTRSDPQDTTSPSNTEDQAGSGSDIVINGVRNAMADARTEKLEANTIVDIVNAEDIGKLPNNTIGDVIASIPGIAVTRSEGEVNDIQLRGLNNVQTTIGGTPFESGAGRVASIADLPADLIKSVEVYKTRTPDQVEGSGAGTINIEFRKPTDFKRTLTVAGNVTGRYNNQSRRINQVYTGIANYRRDTPIGTLGAQFGFTLNYNPFLESKAQNQILGNVQSRQVVGPQILPYPTFAPTEIIFEYTTGSRTTPTFNGALQWSANGNSVVLEGTYATPTFDKYTNSLYVPITLQGGSTNTLPALSNIVLVPGTNRMASVTVSPVTQIGPISYNGTSNDSNFLYKLSGTHDEDLFTAYAEIAYTGGNVDYQQVEFRNRFINRPTVDIKFAGTDYGFPMMQANFSGVDLLDPKQYRFAGAREFVRYYQNRTFATRTDLTLRPPVLFLKSLKFGARFAVRTASQDLSSRSIDNLLIDPASLPSSFANLTPIDEGFGGTKVKNNARWLSYDRFAVRNDYPALREYLAGLPTGAAFATQRPTTDQSTYFDSSERTFAIYGMANYRINLLFPIDGVIGIRATNTAVLNSSFQRRTRNVTKLDANGKPTTVSETIVTPAQGRGNYMSIEPTLTGVVHFTPKLQARLSYNIGIRRPASTDTSPFIVLNDVNRTGDGGNPALQPEKTSRLDAIVEYRFGRVGLVTVNPFYWKLKGAITDAELLESVYEGSGDLYLVNRPYNSGNGYRRGVEMQAQTFFTFLPGILKNFGAIANFTYVDSRLHYDPVEGSSTIPPGDRPITGVAEHVYNIQGLFERGSLNARISYNFNGRYLTSVNSVLLNSTYLAPRDWMDAAINYTIVRGPLKNLGISSRCRMSWHRRVGPSMAIPISPKPSSSWLAPMAVRSATSSDRL